MKKTYVKPYIAVESFQLDAAIAGSCSVEGFVPIGRTETQCVHEETGYFGLQCTHDLSGGNGVFGDGNDTICYHGPEIGITFTTS